MYLEKITKASANFLILICNLNSHSISPLDASDKFQYIDHYKKAEDSVVWSIQRYEKEGGDAQALQTLQ
jgi:hypothetical protein